MGRRPGGNASEAGEGRPRPGGCAPEARGGEAPSEKNPKTVNLSYRGPLHLQIALTYVIVVVGYSVQAAFLPPLLGSHLVTAAVLLIAIFIPFIFLCQTMRMRVGPTTIRVERRILRSRVVTHEYSELLRVRLHPITSYELDPRPPRTARHCVSIETDRGLVPAFAFHSRDKANRLAKAAANRLHLPLSRSTPAAAAQPSHDRADSVGPAPDTADESQTELATENTEQRT